MRRNLLKRITWPSVPAFPPSFPFLLLMGFVYSQLLVTQSMCIPVTELEVFWTRSVAGGISLLTLLKVLGVLFGAYVLLDFLVFYKDALVRRPVGAISCIALVIVMIGLQVCLSSIGTAAESWRSEKAVPLLVGRLGDANEENPEQVARLLGKYGSRAKEAIPTLENAIRKGDSRALRAAAVYALSKIGPDAVSALPLLNECLSDRDPIVRRAAGYALEQITSRAH